MTKAKKQRKKLLIVVIVLMLVAAMAAGIWYFAANRNSEPVFVYEFMYLGMTEYWGDSQESYGPVTTDRIQTVFLTDTQSVTEILVSQGDTVKKGDLLLRFDTTLSDLALERKRLDVEKLKLQLADAQDELRRINNMKPMVIPQPDEDEGEEDENLGEKLEGNYSISTNTDYDGSSAEKSLILWLNSAAAVDDSMLEALLQKAIEYQTINAEKEQEPSGDPSVEPSGDPAVEGLSEGEEAPPEEPSEDPSEDPSGDPDEPEEPVQTDRFYVVIKVTEGNRALAGRKTWEGLQVIRSGDGFKLRFFNAGMLRDHTLTEEENEEVEGPQIDFGSGFTAAQIAEMRAEQQKKIKELEFNLKMAEAEYKIMQTEVSDGSVYATVDGEVVSLLSEEEARMTMQPMLKVSGGGGFYIEGSVSELEKDKLLIGQEVTVNDWNTGMVYTGTVQSIGDFPNDSDYFNGMNNPNASYYPFMVFVDGSADLQEGQYASVMYSAGTSENGIYLENPFLRTENGKTYVYVRGEDGTLEKRFVTTGKSLWGSYTQVLSGIDETDYIAFPYGKNVKPGAPTQEGDMSDLYG
ncbi:MAG: biotin/lipoyl-binding protein [Oscillospiraceae bacterium]|nr:biotin/lipoyl-binding protein [Oscillospiraceae bacterium]